MVSQSSVHIPDLSSEWWKRAGAFHNLDIALIERFLVKAYKLRPNAEDKTVPDPLPQAIANFAKTGDPSPDGG